MRLQGKPIPFITIPNRVGNDVTPYGPNRPSHAGGNPNAIAGKTYPIHYDSKSFGNDETPYDPNPPFLRMREF